MPSQKLTIKIILIGFGVVGEGVAHQLSVIKRDDRAELPVELELYRVIDRGRIRKLRPQKARHLRKYFNNCKIEFAEDQRQLVHVLGNAVDGLSKDLDQYPLVIECTGSKDLSEVFNYCLEKRIPLITANKAFLAANLQLLDSFRKASVPLLFEAAVGGGMSTIKLLRDTFSSDRVSLLAGILNGTTNYILSAMENRVGFLEARERAQQRGLAEPGDLESWDPKADLDLNGSDVFSKITLLSRLVWGWQLPPGGMDFWKNGLRASHIRRIDVRYAKEKLGMAIRFLGVARQIVDAQGKRNIAVFYTPAMLPAEHELCQIRGENNALLVASDFTGTSLSVGPGAGPSPTANAIISDLFYFAREKALHREAPDFASGAVQLQSDNSLILDEFDTIEFSGFYIRFLVKDGPGLVGRITGILGDRSIGVREVLQLDHLAEEIREILKTCKRNNQRIHEGDEWKYLAFALTAERANVGKVIEALKEIDDDLGDGTLIVEPVLMPIMQSLRRVNGWQKRGGLDDLENWSLEAAKRLRGEKLSVDLFPMRYEDTNSQAGPILKIEKKQIASSRKSKENPTTVKRIFVIPNAPKNGALKKIAKDHVESGVEIRILELNKAEKMIERIDDHLLMDFAVYISQEVGIVELASKERGNLKTTDRGYQVYGSVQLEDLIRRFWKLWAMAEPVRQ